MSEKPTCAVCGCDDTVCELRAPCRGWVESGMLPQIICSDCMVEWYDAERDPLVDSWKSVAEFVKAKRKARAEAKQ